MDGHSNLHSEVVLVPTPVQFDKQRNSVKELALFVSLVYVRFWHEALLIINVPLNDMQLLELLTKYLNRTVVKTAEDTLVDTFGIFQRCSLDCLSSTTDVRTQMVANIQIFASEESVKRLGTPLEPLSATGLASCATERTATIFDVFSLNGKTKAQNFLANDLAEWNYQELKTAASDIKVVNDNAERAIALMMLYNSSLTGEQMHYII